MRSYLGYEGAWRQSFSELFWLDLRYPDSADKLFHEAQAILVGHHLEERLKISQRLGDQLLVGGSFLNQFNLAFRLLGLNFGNFSGLGEFLGLLKQHVSEIARTLLLGHRQAILQLSIQLFDLLANFNQLGLEGAQRLFLAAGRSFDGRLDDVRVAAQLPDATCNKFIEGLAWKTADVAVTG